MGFKLTKTFRSFLLSYLFILLIPNISGLVSYRVSVDQAKSSSIETSLILLGQTKSMLERRMAEVDGFTKELALHKEITDLLYQDVRNDPSAGYSLWKTWVSTSGYGKTNDFLENYYIYFKKSNAVLSPPSVYVRPEDFYELNHVEGQTYEQWTKTLQTKQQSTVIPLHSFISEKKRAFSAITFLQSLPLNSFDSPLGTVVVNIDERKISGLLESITKQFGGWAFITDLNGNILTKIGIDDARVHALNLDSNNTAGATQRFMDDGSLLITIRSDSNGWLYAAQIPKPILFERAYAIRNVTWAVTAITFVAGILISLFLAYRNSKPIHRLVGALREQLKLDDAKGKTAYDFLQGNIAALIRNSNRLEEELHRQQPLIKDALLKRLIRGELGSSDEIAYAAAQTGLSLIDQHGFVGMIRINGYGEMESQEIYQEINATRLVIRQVCQKIFQPSCPITDWESDKLAFLLAFPLEPFRSTTEQLEEQIEQLQRQLENHYRISITICMGTPYRSLSEISRSYEDARQAMDRSSFKEGSRVIWYERMEKETATYYYPVDLELRLLQVLKAGVWPEAKRILTNIFERNFIERELLADMSEQLFDELKGTLLKLLNVHLYRDTEELEAAKQQVVQLPISDSPSIVMRNMEELMESFCGTIAERRTESYKLTVSDIQELLETMYGEPDLTVYRIAEKVGRPEKYITQLFKEFTGVSIAEQLEQIRIRRAIELLTQCELTVEEIAEKVGYNSGHSFRRAFKRVTGVTPSQYRTTIE